MDLEKTILSEVSQRKTNIICYRLFMRSKFLTPFSAEKPMMLRRAHMWQSRATDLSQVFPVSQVPGMDMSQRRHWGGVTPGFRSARGTSPSALCRCGEGRKPSRDC